MRKHILLGIFLALMFTAAGCSTNKAAVSDNAGKSIDSGGNYNDYGETPLIEAIINMDTLTIQKILNSGRADVLKPDANGVPPVLAAIEIGLDLDTLDAILQKTPLSPRDIMDRRTKNAYDYVRDYMNNNASYLRLLDKYQSLRE